MLKLARFLKQFRKQVIIGPIFKLTEAIFELIVPIITAKMIDNGVRAGNVNYVWRMGGVMLLLGVVGLCCALICQKLASVASQGFGTAVRSAMYAHINTFSHSEIDKFGTPSLITRITNDVNQLQFAVAMPLVFFSIKLSTVVPSGILPNTDFSILTINPTFLLVVF